MSRAMWETGFAPVKAQLGFQRGDPLHQAGLHHRPDGFHFNPGFQNYDSRRSNVEGSLLAAFSKVTRVWPPERLAPWMRRSTNPGLAVANLDSSKTARATGVTVTPLCRAKRASAASASASVYW